MAVYWKEKFPKNWGLIQFWVSLCFCHFLGQYSSESRFLGVFQILRISSLWWARRFWKLMQKWLRNLKLKLTTLIWKVTERQKNDFCVKSDNFNFNFLSHFCIDFQNICAHHQEEILRILKHPQISTFWWVLAKKMAKNKVAQKLLF